MTPTAARALTLPPLSTVGDGDHVTVRSLAAFALTINVGDPNDHMNDALAGSAAVPGNGNLTVVADKTTVPNTWLSLT
jgi:hypothetical protein